MPCGFEWSIMECSAFRVLGLGFELEGLLRIFGKAAGIGFGA